MGAVIKKFRDYQVAEDFSKQLELGWQDIECVVYGCAYLQENEDKLYYRISSKGEDIYRFIDESVQNNIFPGQVETLRLSCSIPSGTQETIENEMKKTLALQLKNHYP